jgi:uncharacterized protein (TIGR03067 family)
MRRRLLLITSVCLVLPAIAFGDDEAAKKETAKLEGEWVLASMESGGRALKIVPTVLTFRGEEMTFKSRVRGRDGTEKDIKTTARFTIDATKDPKHLDFTTTSGSFAGPGAKAVYAVDGERLTLCYGPPGSERPQTLTSPADSKIIMSQYKRKAK